MTIKTEINIRITQDDITSDDKLFVVFHMKMGDFEQTASFKCMGDVFEALKNKVAIYEKMVKLDIEMNKDV